MATPEKATSRCLSRRSNGRVRGPGLTAAGHNTSGTSKAGPRLSIGHWQAQVHSVARATGGLLGAAALARLAQAFYLRAART